MTTRLNPYGSTSSYGSLPTTPTLFPLSPVFGSMSAALPRVPQSPQLPHRVQPSPRLLSGQPTSGPRPAFTFDQEEITAYLRFVFNLICNCFYGVQDCKDSGSSTQTSLKNFSICRFSWNKMVFTKWCLYVLIKLTYLFSNLHYFLSSCLANIFLNILSCHVKVWLLF